MRFEWDEKKNEENIRKHGIDFEDGHEMFELPMLTNIDRRHTYGEDRYIGIGFLRQRVVVIVFAQPDDDRIRIISLRKALRHEREQFGQFLADQLGSN